MLVRESLPPSFWIRKLYHLWPSIVLPYIGFEGLVNPGRTNWICATWSHHRQGVDSMVEDIWFSTTSTDGSEIVTMSWRVTHIFSFLSTTLTFSRHLSLSEFSPILYFFSLFHNHCSQSREQWLCLHGFRRVPRLRRGRRPLGALRSSNRGYADIVRFRIIVTEQYLTLIALLPWEPYERDIFSIFWLATRQNFPPTTVSNFLVEIFWPTSCG